MWIVGVEMFEIFSSQVYKNTTYFMYLLRGSSTQWHPWCHQKGPVKEQSKGTVWLSTWDVTAPGQVYLALQRGGNLQVQLRQPQQNHRGINSCSVFPSSHHWGQEFCNICINSLLPIYYPGEAELIKYQLQTARSFSMREIVKNHILPLTSHAVPEELR